MSAAGGTDTFPKLLLENARTRGDRPAMREKDLGIWQAWSWRQVLEEVHALACGLKAMGLERGDKVAIVGDNRPRLYWTMVAAQSVGGVPVPVYQDSVADEMAFVIEHAEARFAMAEDQEQVDKLLEILERGPRLEQIVFDDARGMRHYDQDFLHQFEAVQTEGRAYAEANPGFLDAEIAKAGGGKSLETFDIAPFVHVSLADDLEAARLPVKQHLAFYIGGMGAREKNFYNDYAKRLGFEAAAVRIQDLFLGGQRNEAVAAVPDQLVDQVALVGPKARIVERLADWKAAAGKRHVGALLVRADSKAALEILAEAVL